MRYFMWFSSESFVYGFWSVVEMAKICLIKVRSGWDESEEKFFLFFNEKVSFFSSAIKLNERVELNGVKATMRTNAAEWN